MKLTDINIKFNPGKRPEVVVKFDSLIIDAIEQEPDYVARFHPESKTWIYRADCGDFVSCGAELKGQGKARIRMVDGAHTISELHPTNGPAVNAVFKADADPVMDVWVDETEFDEGRLLAGHVNAIAFAKYLFATSQEVALAVVEWPQGLRMYEPVQIVDGEPVPNRSQDRIVFLCRPNEELNVQADER